MNEQMDRARERRNILERLGSKIPGFSGYLEREMRREVDKLQRNWLADQVDRARFAINGKIREWSREGRLDNLDRAGSIEKSLDRMANRIRHADYGSSGFFDAVKIGEAGKHGVRIPLLKDQVKLMADALGGQFFDKRLRLGNQSQS